MNHLRRRWTGPVWLAVWLMLAACVPAPGPAIPPPNVAIVPTPLPATDLDILDLPATFRYQVALRPAGAPDEPLTVITGQYHTGALAQVTRYGEDVPEELIIARDTADGMWRSYTRTEADTAWLRWPGAGFDAGWGLASPFGVLRLYPLANEIAQGEPDPLADIAEPTTKVQAFFTAATIERLLRASIAAVTGQAEERAALEAQLQPLLVAHTVTYWVGKSNRIYQAAATLLTTGQDGEPVPWLEVIWRYWGYNDPAVVVAAPTDVIDVSTLAMTTPFTTPEPTLAPATTLLVRVFAAPGVPASDVTVTVYPAGQQSPLGALHEAAAQFGLPVGAYDVLVQTGDAEEWLNGVEVLPGSVASQDVVLDLGTLTLTVMQDSATPQVDIMVYPAGDRQNPAGWRTKNPATFVLRAGAYDVEVALSDLSSTRRFPGLTVRAGETTTEVLNIDR